MAKKKTKICPDCKYAATSYGLSWICTHPAAPQHSPRFKTSAPEWCPKEKK